jgi:DNA-binding NarL/FixJ family response regulator
MSEGSTALLQHRSTPEALSLDAPAAGRRIVVAVGERLFLEAIRRFLDAAHDLDVVAATTAGHEAVALSMSASPDLVVLDLDLTGMSGLVVAQKLRAAGLRTPFIVLLNTPRDAHHLGEAWAAGVRGFVLKQSTSEDLLHAIRVVERGGSFFDAHLTRDMLAGRGGGRDAGAPPAAEPSARSALTARERDVIHLFALGFTGKEIAHKLSVTPKSVETYKARAMEKLRLSTRSSIVRYGIVQGWFM